LFELERIKYKSYFYQHDPIEEFNAISLFNTLLDELVNIQKKYEVINKKHYRKVLQYGIICKLFIVLQHKLSDSQIEVFLLKNEYLKFENINTRILERYFKKFKRHIDKPNYEKHADIFNEIKKLLNHTVNSTDRMKFPEIYHREL